MSDRTFAAGCAFIVAVVGLGLAVGITSDDVTEWHDLPDRDCKVREHHDNRVLWVPDRTNVSTWCRVDLEVAR